MVSYKKVEIYIFQSDVNTTVIMYDKRPIKCIVNNYVNAIALGEAGTASQRKGKYGLGMCF